MEDSKEEQYEILIVDDNETNRDMLGRHLKRLGYRSSDAANGQEALDMLEHKYYDLVLLDIMMPGMNGYQVLEVIKSEEKLRHIPVIVVSAIQEIESAVRCIELGAEDYLNKPFNVVLLKARLQACLEKKSLLDQERLYRHQIEAEMHRANELLEVILPKNIVEELKETNQVRPRRHEQVAVMICDIAGFTPYSENHPPEEVLSNLGKLTENFEEHTLTYGLEKINSIGDEFMAAGGLSGDRENPVLDCVKCGFDFIQSAQALPAKWNLRIGINVGPVIAGVVGHRKFLFGLWGDTVNTAARMQTNSKVGEIYVTKSAWERLGDACEGESRGIVEVKGKGPMEVFRVARVLEEGSNASAEDRFSEI